MADKQEVSKTLDAWLSTLHADPSSKPVPATVMDSAMASDSLLKLLGAKKHTSAAPLEIGELLAKGGMGVVKLANQQALGRTVVVKTLHPGYPKEAAEHVLREAWATGALEHPNIVPVHDIQIDEQGLPIIVLKRIEGESWTRLMHDPALVQERFGAHDLLGWNLGILQQVCQAIRYAHSRGILHRDIKPDNVMIGSFGEVYVVDWGISVSLDNTSDSPLPKGCDADMVAGTPCYMAPEMLGGSFVDARTDIYLLGAVLFEILANRPPHSTTSRDALLADIHLSEPSFPEHTPPRLAMVCREAMAKEREQRFAQVGDLIASLQAYLQTRGSQDLAEDAEQRLLELRKSLAAQRGRHEVYQVFGAARFGFKAALEEWPGNQQAAASLERAHITMIEYELEQGKPQAAQSLLEGLVDPQSELARRVQDANAAEAARQEELDRHHIDLDSTLGRRTRILFVTSLSVFTFTVYALDRYLSLGLISTFPGMFASNTVLLLAVAGAGYWARESMGRTHLNRKLFQLTLMMFVLHYLEIGGAYLMGFTPAHANSLVVLVWATIATMISVTLDRRFSAAALGYAASFLVAANWPAIRIQALLASNVIMAVTITYLWSRAEKK